MKRKSTFFGLLISASTLFILLGCGSTDDGSTQEQETIAQKPAEEAHVIDESMSVTGTVESVDVETGKITFRNPDGELLMYVTGRDAKRIEEVKLGDLIEIDYIVTLAGDLRTPTDEERAEPLIITQGRMSGPADEAPSGTTMREIRAVVEITNIDITEMEVTIKGPRGRSLSIDIQDPAHLEGVNVGDTVMMTYREAVSIAIKEEAEH